MKDRLITEIEQAMVASLDNAQMKLLHDVLMHSGTKIFRNPKEFRLNRHWSQITI